MTTRSFRIPLDIEIAENKRLDVDPTLFFFILMEPHSTIHDNGLACDVSLNQVQQGAGLLLHLLVQERRFKAISLRMLAYPIRHLYLRSYLS